MFADERKNKKKSGIKPFELCGATLTKSKLGNL